MNTKLKQIILRPSSEQGNVLTIVLGLGAVTILAGATMLARSQGDAQTAVIQNQTVDAAAVAEGGLTRTLSILNQQANSSLLILDYKPPSNPTLNQWTTPPSGTTVNPCVSGNPPTTLTTAQSFGNGTYEVISYDFDNGGTANNPADDKATLIVEGRVGSSKARVEVQVNIVSQIVPNTFPSLYANSIIGMGNNDVNGNIICAGNNTSTSSANCRPSSGGAYCLNPTSAAGQAEARSEIDPGPQMNVAGNVYLGEANLPTILSVPTTPSQVNNLGSI